MRRKLLKPPLWETQVLKTIQKIKENKKTRALKSYDLYECVCIFISAHLRKKIFSKPTISTYYSHFKLFSLWMRETFNLKDIRKIKKTHLHRYFTYIEKVKKHKKASIEGAYTRSIPLAFSGLWYVQKKRLPKR